MIFEGNRYSRKGFLFKSFAMSAVVRRTLLLLLCRTSEGLLAAKRRLQGVLGSESKALNQMLAIKFRNGSGNPEGETFKRDLLSCKGSRKEADGGSFRKHQRNNP